MQQSDHIFKLELHGTMKNLFVNKLLELKLILAALPVRTVEP